MKAIRLLIAIICFSQTHLYSMGQTISSLFGVNQQSKQQLARKKKAKEDIAAKKMAIENKKISLKSIEEALNAAVCKRSIAETEHIKLQNVLDISSKVLRKNAGDRYTSHAHYEAFYGDFVAYNCRRFDIRIAIERYALAEYVEEKLKAKFNKAKAEFDALAS